MKKSWMEIFLLIGAVVTSGMIVSNALFKVSASTTFKAAIFSAALMAGILITMSIVARVADEKGRITNPVSITFLANGCVCFASAIITSHDALYAIVSISLFLIMSIIASSLFANATGTKKWPCFITLVVQAVIIERTLNESWELALIGCTIFFLMFGMVLKRPKWFNAMQPCT